MNTQTIKQDDLDHIENLTLARLAKILGTTSEALQESYGRADAAAEKAREIIRNKVSKNIITVVA